MLKKERKKKVKLVNTSFFPHLRYTKGRSTVESVDIEKNFNSTQIEDDESKKK